MIVAFPAFAAEQSKDVKEAIDVIVLFCVAGGEKFEVSGDAKVEGGVGAEEVRCNGIRRYKYL